MILLDTDIFSLLMRGREPTCTRARQAEDTVAISVVTRVEVLRGRWEFLLKAEDGVQLQRAQLWLDRTEEDLRDWHIIGIDQQSAEAFDRLRKIASLRRIGRGDLLIASTALAHQALLVTRNIRHFRQVPGLRLENWAE
ncbi:type II toxin-antitoxin system VapC family toxin [Aquisphaera insulae]|uniref:type II toxin-antitoxin system VapC family toxin n=1 Tax=Aquisphaera insulae TaxID=2712864 RepID=UPI00196AA78A|nr:type II toxin-antitoxin system VapC family toxin [Aquisphaera insulae]